MYVGEVFVFMGENGVGKSMFFKIFCGLEMVILGFMMLGGILYVFDLCSVVEVLGVCMVL